MPIIHIAAGGAGGAPKVTIDNVKTAADGAGIAPEKVNQLVEGLESLVQSGGGSWVVLILFCVIAIGVSFFCSVWEAVLLSVTNPYIKSLEKKKPKAFQQLRSLKTQIDAPLISILTLNTIAHTVGSMIVGKELTKITGGDYRDFIGNVLMTLAVLIASEIIPKNLGARNWKTWAPWVGRCLHWLTRVMSGLQIIRIIRAFSKGGHHEDTISREELTVMAEMGRLQGKLDAEESQVIENVLTLSDRTVEEIMTPRVVMFSLPGSMTVREYLTPKYVKEQPFSRIPIYDGDDKEEIIGFVLKDDILLAAAEDKFDKTLLDLKNDVAMMSELTLFPEAWKALQDEQLQLAIVHDEYGGVTGIVTIEDFTEELWGMEIVDEVDQADDMQEMARSLWKHKSQREGIKLIKKDDEETSDNDKDSEE